MEDFFLFFKADGAEAEMEQDEIEAIEEVIAKAVEEVEIKTGNKEAKAGNSAVPLLLGGLRRNCSFSKFNAYSSLNNSNKSRYSGRNE